MRTRKNKNIAIESNWTSRLREPEQTGIINYEKTDGRRRTNANCRPLHIPPRQPTISKLFQNLFNSFNWTSILRLQILKKKKILPEFRWIRWILVESIRCQAEHLFSILQNIQHGQGSVLILWFMKKHLRPSEDSAPPGIDWIPSRSAGHFVIFCLKQQQKKIPGNWNMR